MIGYISVSPCYVICTVGRYSHVHQRRCLQLSLRASCAGRQSSCMLMLVSCYLQPGQMGSGRRVSPLNTVVSMQSEPTAFQEPAFHDPAEGIGVRSDGEHRYSVSRHLELDAPLFPFCALQLD